MTFLLLSIACDQAHLEGVDVDTVQAIGAEKRGGHAGDPDRWAYEDPDRAPDMGRAGEDLEHLGRQPFESDDEPIEDEPVDADEEIEPGVEEPAMRVLNPTGEMEVLFDSCNVVEDAPPIVQAEELARMMWVDGLECEEDGDSIWCSPLHGVYEIPVENISKDGNAAPLLAGLRIAAEGVFTHDEATGERGWAMSYWAELECSGPGCEPIEGAMAWPIPCVMHMTSWE